jgi:type II secretory pathway pseudopilin PulG
MLKSDINNKKKGMSLVEVIVSATIVTLILSGLIAAYNLYFKTALANLRHVQAVFLAEEGAEALRFLRDASWSNLSSLTVNNTYYVIFQNGNWQITTNNIFVDGIFERKFVLNNVNRDGTDDIVPTGTLDPNTKKVTVSISWGKGVATTTKSLEFYLTNIFSD